MSWKKHLTKLCKKCPLHLTYVLALPWEVWIHRLGHQCSTYLYILMYHWAASNTTGSYCLKNRQVHSKLHRLYTTCSKCPPPAQTKISDVDKLRWCIKNEWTIRITLFIERAVGYVAAASVCLRLCWRQTFRAYDVKMTWLTARLTFFETITASRFVTIQWFIKMHMSVLHWRLNLSLQISQGSAVTYFRWSGHFLHSFVKCSLQDMPTNFYWNWLISSPSPSSSSFNYHTSNKTAVPEQTVHWHNVAGNMLAQFFWDTV